MAEPSEFSSLSARRHPSSRLSGALTIVGALVVLAIAWTHRPLEMRNYGEATMAAMQGDWVLRPPFFYGSLLGATVLLVVGILRLRRPGDA